MSDGGGFDGRKERRSKVVPFLSNLERDRKKNLASLRVLAEGLRDHITFDLWEKDDWSISSPGLLYRVGKNRNTAVLSFSGQKQIGGQPIGGDFNTLAKALVVLRYHRNSQSIENQRSFITAVSYVEKAANGSDLFQLTEEHLNRACDEIAKDYKEGSAYNLHKAVGEFAAHVDSNGLAKIPLNFKYARMKRPPNAGGLEIVRLDAPEALITSSEKMASVETYQLLGALYQRVPREHRYRLPILILSVLAAAGRRFSEVSGLPLKCLEVKPTGEVALRYFQGKASKGRTFTPFRKVWLATEMAQIVVAAVEELTDLCSGPRATATRMRQLSGPDLSFLDSVDESAQLGIEDLEGLGLSGALFQTNGWLRKNGLAWIDPASEQKESGAVRWVTTVNGIREYCARDFQERLIKPIHIDQFGAELYLEDMLICQHMYLGGSDAARMFWLANSYSHVMLDKFIQRALPQLAKEFAPEIGAKIDFTSHAFRHTINTLLDEGGVPELLQTDWFGRNNPRDTKAYQHTSRAKRVLEVRQALRDGNANGLIRESLKKIPIELHDAYLEARVRAVHDVGPGVCIHDFSQVPCERHLQCSAECDDLVWAESDPGRIEEIKRQWAMAAVALETAEKRALGDRPRKSRDWISHTKKKLRTLQMQLSDNGVAPFDPHDYLRGTEDEK